MDVEGHLKALCELTGPPGYEAPVRDFLREAWAELVDEFDTDGLGSLIGIKRGDGPEPRPKIMLAAHMDEIGLIVRDIDGAFLRVSRMGGSDPRQLIAQPVVVHGKRELPGVIASKPPHVTPQKERNEYPSIEDYFVDVGLPEDEVQELVRVGDIITFDAPPVNLANGRLASKSMDDRAGVASLTVCLDTLRNRRHSWDVMAVATSREEVGLMGAKTGAFHIKPDLAIAVDVTFASQPGVSETRAAFKLGEGPTIGLGPNFHPVLFRHIKEVAERLEIPLHVDPIPGRSGTDAWAIQITHHGIPTALLSIPLRYMHSSVETLAVKDVERVGRLMAEFIAGLEPDYLDKLALDGEEEKEDES